MTTAIHLPSDHAALGLTADPRVDAYIDSLPDWQQAICREVRALAHAADREVTETIPAVSPFAQVP